MDTLLIGKLKIHAQILENDLGVTYAEAFKLAIEMWKADSLDSIAYFLRDGQFEELMTNITNAINEKP